jgi:23S rRNA pseudouridine1911/1915/1917 synthase
MTDSFTYSKDLPPVRLDKALARQLGLGLRRCRTLIEDGRVLVDDKRCVKGALIHPGQHVRVVSDESVPACQDVRIVAQDGRFAALAKPGGLHTVAGRGAGCLEDCLPQLGLDGWELVNRLDHLTSGLVLAAASADDAAAYKAWQDEAKVCKWYLALAHGELEGLQASQRILDDKRRVVRVTLEQDSPLRWTQARAVRPVEGHTLLLVKIFKGRRHQIRAHLAHAGHPLVGDPVYGAGEPGGLYLHHWRLDLPGFSASVLPDWPWVDAEKLRALVPEFDSM